MPPEGEWRRTPWAPTPTDPRAALLADEFDTLVATCFPSLAGEIPRPEIVVAPDPYARAAGALATYAARVRRPHRIWLDPAVLDGSTHPDIRRPLDGIGRWRLAVALLTHEVAHLVADHVARAQGDVVAARHYTHGALFVGTANVMARKLDLHPVDDPHRWPHSRLLG